jgi:hypothetical protein
MCFSAKDSIIAFSIGFLSSLLLILSKNKKHNILGYFFLFVIVMQIFDYIFWTNPPPSPLNKKATLLAMIFNHLQPIVLFLLLLKFGILPSRLAYTLISLYTICIIIYSYYGYIGLEESEKYTYTYKDLTNDSNIKGLYWKWNHFRYSSVMYLLFLVTLTVLMLELKGRIGVVGGILAVATFLYSFYKYQTIGSTGRMWCKIVAIAPIIFLML